MAIVLYCIVLCGIVVYCIVLHGIVLNCSKGVCTVVIQINPFVPNTSSKCSIWQF